MNKKIVFIFCAFLFSSGLWAQQAVSIYDTQADPAKDLAVALKKAATNGKHIFIKVGGNWCPWCIKFHKFVEENKALDSLVKANYEMILVNYSQENENIAFLSQYNFPQRFGYPVFLFLDAKGKLLHTQDSEYLEEGKNYSEEKVTRMFRMWSPVTIKQAAEKYAKPTWRKKK